MGNRMDDWGFKPGTDDAAMEEAKEARATTYGQHATPGATGMTGATGATGATGPQGAAGTDPRLTAFARAFWDILPVIFEGDQGRHNAERDNLMEALRPLL